MNMSHIAVRADWTKSPQHEFLKRFNLAFTEWDLDFILEHISDDFLWEKRRGEQVIGKPAFEKLLRSLNAYPPKEFIIQSIIVEGNEAAVRSSLTMKTTRYSVCDFYVLEGPDRTMIREMHTFMEKISSDPDPKAEG